MLAYTGYYYAGTLPAGFFHHDFTHDGTVRIIEVADGFVHQQEIEGLHQGANHRHSLLLTVTHAPHLGRHLVSYAEALEPRLYLPTALMIGKAVLYLHILHPRQFGKQPQFLEEKAQAALSEGCPFRDTMRADVPAIEADGAEIVLAVTYDITAQRTLSSTRVGLDKIGLALVEGDILQPDLTLELAVMEDLRQCVIQFDSFHLFLQTRFDNVGELLFRCQLDFGIVVLANAYIQAVETAKYRLYGFILGI